MSVRNSGRDENRRTHQMELNVYGPVLQNIFDIFDGCYNTESSKLNNNFLVCKFINDASLHFYANECDAVDVVFTQFGEFLFRACTS